MKLKLFLFFMVLCSIYAFSQPLPGGSRLKDIAGSKWIGFFTGNKGTPFTSVDNVILDRESNCRQLAYYPMNLWSSPNTLNNSDMLLFKNELDHAVSLGKKTILHMLAGPNQYYPKWFLDGTYTNTELDNMLKWYIQNVISAYNYSTTIDLWNVVNEALDCKGNGWEATKWLQLGYEPDASGLTGSDKVFDQVPVYVRKAFEYARMYTARDLELRDYANEGLERGVSFGRSCGATDDVKTRAFYQLTKHLLNKNAPINAVGFQCHFFQDVPQDFSKLTATIQKFKNLGLKVHLTEIDVQKLTSTTGQAGQKDFMVGLFQAAIAGGADGFSFWGVRDIYSWKGLVQEPLIFDRYGNAKFSYYGIQSVFSGTPMVPVTGVSVNNTTINLNAVTISQQMNLPTVSPSNATCKNVIYTSSNPLVARVSDTGLVTAMDAGNAVITISTVDGNKTATVNVNVTGEIISNRALNKITTTSSVNTANGGKLTGSMSVDGDTTLNPFSRWVSANTPTITAPEWIEIDLAGSYYISSMKLWTGDGQSYNSPLTAFSFQYWDGLTWQNVFSETANTKASYVKNFSAVTTTKVRLYLRGSSSTVRLYEIEVYGLQSIFVPVINVTGVTLTPNTGVIPIGATMQLTQNVIPSNATIKAVSYTSSNNNIATVSASGLVTGVAAGSVTITASTLDGNYTATCSVTVNNSSNVALNKATTTSSVNDASGGMFVGSKAVDGDNSSNDLSRWCSANTPGVNTPEWIEIDLAGNYSINSMKLWTGASNTYNTPLTAFKLQYWDGLIWQDIFSETANVSSSYSKEYTPVTTSKVRLYITGCSYIVRLYEIEIYGSAFAVSSFTINDNNAYAANPVVLVNNTVVGAPTHYIISESPTFGTNWQPYTSVIYYTLQNITEGLHTLSFKAKFGSIETPTVSHKFYLKAPHTKGNPSILQGVISPNPVSNMAKLKMVEVEGSILKSAPSQEYQVSFYTISGQLLRTGKHVGSEFEFNLSDLPLGHILVKIQGKDTCMNKLIVKN